MGCAASVPGENKPGDAPKASQGEKAVDGFSKAAPKPVVVDGKPVPVSIATRPSQVSAKRERLHCAHTHVHPTRRRKHIIPA